MKSKKWTIGLLILYLIGLTWIVIFKLALSFKDLPHMRNVNLIPFGASVVRNGKIYYGEIIQNVLAFIPFGVYLHILWEEKSILKQFLPVVLLSLFYEITQFVFAIGGTDITDLITNSVGGMIGICIAIILSKIVKKSWIKIINIVSFIGAILLVFFIGLLVLRL